MWPFRTKAHPDPKPSDTPEQPAIMYLSSGAGVAVVNYKDALSAASALSHPIVMRALNVLATSVQQIPWFAEVDPDAAKSDRTGKTRQIEDLNNLLKRPNEEMTPAMLRYWLALNYAIYTRVPLKVSFSAVQKERVNGLYPLEVQYVKADLNKRGIPKDYAYGNDAMKNAERYPSRQFAKPGESFVDMIWKPGLSGYQSAEKLVKPLDAIGLPADVVKYLMIRAVRTAQGHPNVRYIVLAEKTLTDPQLNALKKHLNDDHEADGDVSGKIPVIRNAGKVEIHKVDNDLSDIHSKTPSDDMARLIFGAFGIPIALTGMGSADSAKFASNYTESRASFWQDTIIPGYVSPIFQGMTRMICPPGIRISADFDAIPALVAGRASVGKELSEVTFLTTEEKRVLMGWAPKPLDGMGTLPAETPASGNTTEENNNDDE